MADLAESNSAVSMACTTESPFPVFVSWNLEVVIAADFVKCSSKARVFSNECLADLTFDSFGQA